MVVVVAASKEYYTQGVPNARRKFSSKVKVESEEEAYMN
jgi:hypothetical protein